jgi:hypothetical protein
MLELKASFHDHKDLKKCNEADAFYKIYKAIQVAVVNIDHGLKTFEKRHSLDKPRAVTRLGKQVRHGLQFSYL